MAKSVDFLVIGKSAKVTKLVDALIPFVKDNFNTKGKRLGFDSFVKQFGKYNEEKNTVVDTSIPTVKDIRIACRSVAESLKNEGGEVIPVVFVRNGITTIECKNAVDFDSYYPPIKTPNKKAVDYTAWIINAMTKHATEIDFTAIEVAIEGLKNPTTENAENAENAEGIA